MKILKDLFVKFPSCLATYGVIIGMILLAVYARNTSKEMHDGLPPRIEVPNYYTALTKTLESGKTIMPVLGTGSMYPYIKAAKPEEDPFKTIVAVVALDEKFPYDDIQKGDLIVYKIPPDYTVKYVHQALSKDSGGWIMTGLSVKNRNENNRRMTPNNYVGKVVTTYVWD